MSETKKWSEAVKKLHTYRVCVQDDAFYGSMALIVRAADFDQAEKKALQALKREYGSREAVRVVSIIRLSEMFVE